MKRIVATLYRVYDFFYDYFLCTWKLFLILGLLVTILALWMHFVITPEQQRKQAEWEAFLATVPKTMCVGGYEYEAVYWQKDNQTYADTGARLTKSVNGYTVYKTCNPYKPKMDE